MGDHVGRDGRRRGGQSSILLFSFASIRDGMADSFSLRGICAWWIGWLARIGHFDRGRPGWRALSKISTINTTFSSSLPMTPRPDLDLIDDTHIHRLHDSSWHSPSTTFFDAPASPAPPFTLTPHLTQYTHHHPCPPPPDVSGHEIVEITLRFILYFYYLHTLFFYIYIRPWTISLSRR
jgi:hypothetical protein